MRDSVSSKSIEFWLADIRVYLGEIAPELLPILAVYEAEAIFGRHYINDDLMSLPANASVVEVGAGAFLLSCQLVREGFDATGLEPTGSGFAHFERMRQLVLERATALGCAPRILEQPAETLSHKNCFDYAFSINVMEHVDDVDLSLDNITASLKPGAIFRFTCPNYLFPYEPHFNIPTFFSKRLTSAMLHSKIYACQSMPDPAGTWDSLNWINVVDIKNFATQRTSLKLEFNRNILVSTIERVISDKEFALRRSASVRAVLRALVSLRVHKLFAYIPAVLQPIIDCKIEKITLPQSIN